ncbi:MAG: nucleotidyl transferase AbiEii/AbiGii toxin family protein [Enhydrobacter sp.]|nr:nucleotidyl transferase AbiEii/AbiGii toxin family protein [Enhydrobacter sp.]
MLRCPASCATVGGAKIRVIVDIGFGDAVEPQPAEADIPTLLDLPLMRMRAYAPETVIAEKFQAMVMLGRANSRMKDFYDIWMLSRSYDQSAADTLARAIAATFARRNTDLPRELPDALTDAFAALVPSFRRGLMAAPRQSDAILIARERHQTELRGWQLQLGALRNPS